MAKHHVVALGWSRVTLSAVRVSTAVMRSSICSVPDLRAVRSAAASFHAAPRAHSRFAIRVADSCAAQTRCGERLVQSKLEISVIMIKESVRPDLIELLQLVCEIAKPALELVCVLLCSQVGACQTFKICCKDISGDGREFLSWTPARLYVFNCCLQAV